MRVEVEGTGERELMSEAVQQKKANPIAARVTIAVIVTAQWFTASFLESIQLGPASEQLREKKPHERENEQANTKKKKIQWSGYGVRGGEEPARERGVHEEES